MIKILHIVDNYLPQTEQWLYNLLCHQKNIEIHIAAKTYLDHSYENPSHFQFLSHDLSKNELEDRDAKWQNNPLKKLKIKLNKRSKAAFNTLLKKYIEDNNIDMIHAHFANIAWSVIPVSQELNIPLIASFYGWDYEMLPCIKPEWKDKYQELFTHTTEVFTEENHGKTILESYGCPEQKIKIQRLGIQIDSKKISKTKSKDKLRLIQIASFAEKKGQLQSVQAFQKAIGENPNMTLTLVGNIRDQDYYDKVNNYIVKNKLEKKIRIEKRFVDYKNIADILVEYDVFIHPSQYAQNNDCEGGAPTILFDAMLAGLPVISTTHCDIPNVVIHGKSGRLVDEKDINALAKTILYFSNTEQENYEKYSHQARQTIKRKFDIELNAQKMVDCYYSIFEKTSLK